MLQGLVVVRMMLAWGSADTAEEQQAAGLRVSCGSRARRKQEVQRGDGDL